MRFIHEEMKVPEKIAEETRPKRDAILDAARTLFAKQGYEETTIADIAGAAGVAVGTVYLYFRNKHEVYPSARLMDRKEKQTNGQYARAEARHNSCSYRATERQRTGET